MSKIFYKFNAAKDFDAIVFDGTSLSVFDLKREIMLAKKLGKGLDFDLAISDAQSKEEYRDDNFQIPRNASVIVRRIPVRDERRSASRYLVGSAITRRGVHVASSDLLGSGMPGNRASFGTATMQSSTAPLPSADMQPIPRADGVATLVGETEEDRIAALFQQSDEQWQKQSQQLAISQAQKGLNWRPRPPPAPSGSSAATTTTGASSGPNVRPVVQANAYQANEYMRPLPPTYVCFRCGMKGHWIQFCPTLSNKEFDKFRVKKTTGIPKAFLKTVQGGEQGLAALPQDMIQQGVMVTPTGELVVQQINDKAWKEHSARTQAQAAAVNLDHIFDQALELEQKGKVPKGHLIPAVFQCFLCKGLARDAVRVACCQSVFCDACIRSELHAQLSRGVDVSTTCPSCHQLTSTDKLIPDNALRREIQSQLNKVADFIRRSGAGSIAAVDRLQSVSPLPSQSSSAAADSRPMSREEGGQTQTPEKDDRRQYVVDDRDYRNRPRDRAYHHGDRDRSYNGDRDRYRRPRENEDRLQQRRRSSSRERRHRREDDERRPRERSRSPYRSKRARSRSDSRSRHSRRRS